MNSKANDFGLLILRVGLGLIILYYGSQKLLGAFGGAGFSATLAGFESRMGIPPVFAALAIFAEFFGALGLIFGALTRVAALGLASTMAVAAFTKVQDGTIWGKMAAGSLADASQLFFPLALFFGYLAILVTGPGSFALDKKLFGKKSSRKAASS